MEKWQIEQTRTNWTNRSNRTNWTDRTHRTNSAHGKIGQTEQIEHIERK